MRSKTLCVIVAVVVILNVIVKDTVIAEALVIVAAGETAPERVLCLLVKSCKIWAYRGDGSHLLQKQHETVFLVVKSYKMCVLGAGGSILLYAYMYIFIYIYYIYTLRYILYI